MEEWRDIRGFEGKYQISSHGRVKSLSRVVVTGRGICWQIPEKILKLDQHWKGYQRLLIRVEGRRDNLFVHRLVAEAFLLNPQGHSIVNHKNRDKADNHVANLEWCTASDNMLHWREDDRQKQAIETPYEEPIIDLSHW